MIADLEDMVKYCLGQYGGYRKMVENSNSPPSRLIFYRGKAFGYTLSSCRLTFRITQMVSLRDNFSMFWIKVGLIVGCSCLNLI